LRPREPTSYQFSVNHQLSQIFHEDENLSRAFPANTLDRSSGDLRSRSATEHITGTSVAPSTNEVRGASSSRPLCGLASKLLLMQKTELPCLSTVCLGKTRHRTQFICFNNQKVSFQFATNNHAYIGKTVSRSEHPRTLGLNLQPGTRLTFCGWPLRPAHLRWTGPRLDHFSLFEAQSKFEK
jgi:hypothetical protein